MEEVVEKSNRIESNRHCLVLDDRSRDGRGVLPLDHCRIDALPSSLTLRSCPILLQAMQYNLLPKEWSRAIVSLSSYRRNFFDTFKTDVVLFDSIQRKLLYDQGMNQHQHQCRYRYRYLYIRIRFQRIRSAEAVGVRGVLFLVL